MPLRSVVRKLGLRHKPKLLFIDVYKLYSNTLYRSENIRPWAIENGKYIALQMKYDFASCYLSAKDEFNYQQSEYFQYIEKYNSDNYTGIYEGNNLWAYANAENMCKRYMEMMNLFVKHINVYNGLNRKNVISSFELIYDDIIDFEKRNQVKIRYIEDQKQTIRKESDQYNEPRERLNRTLKKRLVGHLIPTGQYLNGNIVCDNGTHRLALFKTLHEIGVYTNDFPLYLKRKMFS